MQLLLQALSSSAIIVTIGKEIRSVMGLNSDNSGSEFMITQTIKTTVLEGTTKIDHSSHTNNKISDNTSSNHKAGYGIDAFFQKRRALMHALHQSSAPTAASSTSYSEGVEILIESSQRSNEKQSSATYGFQHPSHSTSEVIEIIDDSSEETDNSNESNGKKSSKDAPSSEGVVDDPPSADYQDSNGSNDSDADEIDMDVSSENSDDLEEEDEVEVAAVSQNSDENLDPKGRFSFSSEVDNHSKRSSIGVEVVRSKILDTRTLLTEEKSMSKPRIQNDTENVKDHEQPQSLDNTCSDYALAQALAEEFGYEVVNLSSEEDQDSDGDPEEFVVERILDHRKLRGGKIQYLIKWYGYPRSSATWEPREHLDGCQELLASYQKKHNIGGSSSNLISNRKRKNSEADIKGTDSHILKKSKKLEQTEEVAVPPLSAEERAQLELDALHESIEHLHFSGSNIMVLRTPPAARVPSSTTLRPSLRPAFLPATRPALLLKKSDDDSQISSKTATAKKNEPRKAIFHPALMKKRKAKHKSKPQPKPQSKGKTKTKGKANQLVENITLPKDEREGYIVNQILDHFKQGARIRYLVRWQDCDSDKDTWEPAERLLPHAQDILNEYERSCGLTVSGEKS